MSTVNIEGLVFTYLNGQSLGCDITPETPDDQTAAWIKVTLLGTRIEGNSNADVFHDYHVQFDCYAGIDGPEGQSEAEDYYQLLRAALTDWPAVGGEVTAVRFTNAMRLPDPSFKPSRQRYILDAHFFARESVGS